MRDDLNWLIHELLYLRSKDLNRECPEPSMERVRQERIARFDRLIERFSREMTAEIRLNELTCDQVDFLEWVNEMSERSKPTEEDLKIVIGMAP